MLITLPGESIAFIGQAGWIICFRWRCGVWWAGTAPFKLPWTEQSKRAASQRKAGGLDPDRWKKVMPFTAPSHWALFFWQALDVWAMGVTLYCFVFACMWGVLCPGVLWVALGTNSYPCRETELYSFKSYFIFISTVRSAYGKVCLPQIYIANIICVISVKRQPAKTGFW